MADFAHTIRDWWLAVAAHRSAAAPAPEVIVHDPDAQRPHDLDDPFFDPGVQSRIASVIANYAVKKH